MIFFNGDTNSVLPFSCMAGPVEFLGIFAEHCFFCLLVITTELLFRRYTSWRQHTENLALAISWISIFWSYFPVRILIVPILREWKFLFLKTFVDLKLFDQDLRVYAVNTSLRYRCAILHVHPRWIFFSRLKIFHRLLLYSFSISLRSLPVAICWIIPVCYMLNKCQKGRGKSNLQVKYVKKSTSKKAQLVETFALHSRLGSGGTVIFRRVHGGALVGN